MKALSGKSGLEKYSRERCGASSVYYALKDVLEGVEAIATFEIRDHQQKFTQEKLHATFSVGRAEVRGVMCWRWCGENNNPDGAGSHAVLASWDEQDLGLACAVVACFLGKEAQEHGAWIFKAEGPCTGIYQCECGAQLHPITKEKI